LNFAVQLMSARICGLKFKAAEYFALSRKSSSKTRLKSLISKWAVSSLPLESGRAKPKAELRCKLSSRALRRKFRKLIRVDDLTHEFEIPRTEKARKEKWCKSNHGKVAVNQRRYLGLD